MKGPSINGREIRVGIVYGLGGVILIPERQEERKALEEHCGETILITLTNPLKKITRSCTNCKNRTECEDRNLGKEHYEIAANCERWDNKRISKGTTIYKKTWVRCPKDGAIMQHLKGQTESFCPLCKEREKREKGSE